MLRVLKAELFKLSKNRTFKVLCIVCIFLSLLMLLLTSSFMEKILMDSLNELTPEQKEMVLNQMNIMSSSSQVIQPGNLGFHLVSKDAMNPTAMEVFHASFGSGAMELLIGILVGALMAKEYSEGTIKNTLAYGNKRYEFYIAKFLSMVVAITILLAFLTLISTTGSIIMNGWGEPFKTSQLGSMAITFIVVIMANSAVAAILMIIAITIKSNGGSIGISVALFVLVPSIIGFIYGTYTWFDRLYEVTPFYNSALAASLNATNGDLLKSMVISIITISISLLVGIQIFKAQDIK